MSLAQQIAKLEADVRYLETLAQAGPEVSAAIGALRAKAQAADQLAAAAAIVGLKPPTYIHGFSELAAALAAWRSA